MSIKAVFTDMDGTLLNPQHQISDYTAGILRELKKKGVYFIVATGRPYADVYSTVKKCNLEPDFIITSDGAHIRDGSFNLVREHNIEPELAQKMVQIRKVKNPVTGEEEKKFTTNIYREAEWWTDKNLPDLRSAFSEDLHVVDFGEKLYDLPAAELSKVHLMWFCGQHEDLEPVNALLQENYESKLTWTFSMPYILNINPLGVSKGNGVREVAELLGLSLSEVACFGDGMNDESMLQIAGRAFITENGQQGLKDAVKHGEVIESNANDGVAKKLEELFFSK
uniref:Haloacid dehalogenase-like hydrolase-like protein n=1 Tax=Angomonas deanei TaxID=59799 RepID=C6K3T0_9TRYP|nr:haloacid dehalogenase-like hydrolase-like protein [Angomonas deanei]